MASAGFERVSVPPALQLGEQERTVVPGGMKPMARIRSPTSKEPARIEALALPSLTERPRPLMIATGVPSPSATLRERAKVPPWAWTVSLCTSDCLGGRLVGPEAATSFQAGAGASARAIPGRAQKVARESARARIGRRVFTFLPSGCACASWPGVPSCWPCASCRGACPCACGGGGAFACGPSFACWAWALRCLGR